MNTVQINTRIMWTAVVLALFTALSYILIQFKVLGVGDLQESDKPVGIIYVAAGSCPSRWFACPHPQSWPLALRRVHQCDGHSVLLQHVSEPSCCDALPRRVGLEDRAILLEFALIYVIAVNWKKPINTKKQTNGG